ncbi:MAG TPA: DUF1236 domain-containing protein [Xanthobacteraceae bacterium]|nr:DUF1236 domain-containing protein [Xanthobacteraceae bacterium]
MRKAFMIGAAASTLLLAAGAASAQTDQLKPPAPQSNKSDAMPAKSGKQAQQPMQRSKSETTGQASGDVKQQLGTDTKAQKNERKSSATSKSRSETTGQANTEIQKNDQQKSGGKETDKNLQMKSSGSTSGAVGTSEKGSQASSASSASSGGSAGVKLTQAQKTKIRQTVITTKSAPRVTHVDFDVRVGTHIPRRIHLAPVPLVLVDIEPTWRGYEYFLVGDEIVVVNPRTMEIVAVLSV